MTRTAVGRERRSRRHPRVDSCHVAAFENATSASFGVRGVRSFSSDWNPYNHGPSTEGTKTHEASKTGFSSATARVCISRCATPRHAGFYFTLYDILTRADHPVWRIYVRQPLLLHSPSLASSRMRRFEKRRARRHARRHRDDDGGSGVPESLVFCSRGVVGLAAVFASPIVCGDEETRGDTRVGVSRNVSSSPSRAVAASAVSRRARRRRTSFSASAAFCSSPPACPLVVADVSSPRLDLSPRAPLASTIRLISGSVARMCCAQAYATPAGTSDKTKCHACQSHPSRPARCAANTSSAAWPNSRGRPARTSASGDAADEDAEDEHAGRVAASEADSPPRAASPETHRRAPASARGRTPPRVSHAAAVAENAPLAVDARAPLARPPASASRAARSIILRARHTDDGGSFSGRSSAGTEHVFVGRSGGHDLFHDCFTEKETCTTSTCIVMPTVMLPSTPLNHPQAGWWREPHHLQVQVQGHDPLADAHVPVRKPSAGQVDDEVLEKKRDVLGGGGQVDGER